VTRRQQLEFIERLRDLIGELPLSGKPSRELSLAITNAQQALFWLREVEAE